MVDPEWCAGSTSSSSSSLSFSAGCKSLKSYPTVGLGTFHSRYYLLSKHIQAAS
jgi:hypothetical protein